MTNPSLLIVEDDFEAGLGLSGFLKGMAFQVELHRSIQEVFSGQGRSIPHLALLDYQLPDGDAITLMHKLRESQPDLPVIILTAFGSIDLAVRAIQEGADHFMVKPVDLPALVAVIRRLLAQRREGRQLAGFRRRGEVREVDPFGADGALARLGEQAARAAASDRPILIQGETGSGKGVLARWIHRQSPRAEEAFVDLNCAGLTRDFLESELFGHEKGAFTGAVAQKQGLLELASGGSCFLDEIGDMDLTVQPKLLKVVEEKGFRRMGGLSERRVDVRLLAATHRDLEGMAAEGKFRPDLYYRLSTLVLRIPPLRERLADLPALAGQILARVGREVGRPDLELSPAAADRLRAYAWPGNVRELRNVLERAAILGESSLLSPADLDLAGERRSAPAAPAEWSLEALTRSHILRALAESKGRVDEAARLLDIPRSTLYTRLKAYGVSPGQLGEG